MRANRGVLRSARIFIARNRLRRKDGVLLNSLGYTVEKTDLTPERLGPCSHKVDWLFEFFGKDAVENLLFTKGFPPRIF
jgi:hypothetical protein